LENRWNCASVLCRFWDMASYLSKVADFNPPNLHLAPRRSLPRSNFAEIFGVKKLDFWANQWCLFDPKFTRFGRTPTCGRETQAHSIYGASIASRGKNQYKAMRRPYAKSLDNETVQSVWSRGPSYKISYDSLTIILRQCQSYDRLTIDVSFTKHLTKNARLFSGTIHLQNRKIVWDSVRTLAYDIPRRNLSTLYKSLS